MQKCNTLNIVTNSNGIVRAYADGGMVFEIQADYVKTESYVACDKPPISGTVPESKLSKSGGRVAIDHSEIPELSEEEKYRLKYFSEQPESKYFK